MIKKILLIVGLCILSLVGSAQEAPKFGPVIRFESVEHDYGTISKGDNGDCRFVFWNDGDEPLILQYVYSSCGCAKPTYTQKPVMPRQKGYVDVQYNTNNLGEFSKKITVVTNAVNSERISLKIHGEVVKDASPAPTVAHKNSNTETTRPTKPATPAKTVTPAKTNPIPAPKKPEIVWGYLPENVTSQSLSVSVEVKSESKLTDCRLTMGSGNDRGMALVPAATGYNRTLKQTLTLREGVNTLTVTATNAAGTTVERRTVTYTPPVRPVASKQSRIALVMGNANYNDKDMCLANPVNDANAVASALQKLGFTVIRATDKTHSEMDKAISDFGKKAGGYDVALFYYAGHGISVGGSNYMVPVDANCEDENQVKYQCTDINYVLDAIEKCELKIVMLDACRNNPFARSWGRRGAAEGGLVGMNSPSGTFISFATAPGTTAADGKGAHSPYTSALLQMLQQKNVVLETFFKQVRVKVRESTDGRQSPWESNSTTGDFYFNQ